MFHFYKSFDKMAEKEPQNVVAKLEQQLQEFGDGIIQVSGTSDPKVQSFIINVSTLLNKAFDNIRDRFNDEQLCRFQYKISKLSCNPNVQIWHDISQWCSKRKDMIKIIDSSAKELDQSFFLSTIGRLVGSCVDLFHNIDSIFDNKFTKNITEQAFGISPKLGLASHILFQCVPHLAYMGLVSSFGDVMNSKWIMENVLKVYKEDKELFERIEPWLKETAKLDAEIKDLFPFGIDGNLIADIEKAYEQYDGCTKVFATALFSNIKKNPKLIQNPKFLCELFLFSRSEAASEWYNRTSRLEHPIQYELTKLEMRTEFLNLSKSAPEIAIDVSRFAPKVTAELTEFDSESSNKKVINLKLDSVPYFIQIGINCISIYFSYQELKNGDKHGRSDMFRELSKEANKSLRAVSLIKNLKTFD